MWNSYVTPLSRFKMNEHYLMGSLNRLLEAILFPCVIWSHAPISSRNTFPFTQPFQTWLSDRECFTKIKFLVKIRILYETQCFVCLGIVWNRATYSIFNWLHCFLIGQTFSPIAPRRSFSGLLMIRLNGVSLVHSSSWTGVLGDDDASMLPDTMVMFC